MLIISLFKVRASWDDSDTKWVSEDSFTQRILNDTLRDSAVNSYSAFLMIGGVQGEALRAAKKVFGSSLRVIKKIDPPPVPPPPPGAVH